MNAPRVHAQHLEDLLRSTLLELEARAWMLHKNDPALVKNQEAHPAHHRPTLSAKEAPARRAPDFQLRATSPLRGAA